MSTSSKITVEGASVDDSPSFTFAFTTASFSLVEYLEDERIDLALYRSLVVEGERRLGVTAAPGGLYLSSAIERVKYSGISNLRPAVLVAPHASGRLASLGELSRVGRAIVAEASQSNSGECPVCASILTSADEEEFENHAKFLASTNPQLLVLAELSPPRDQYLAALKFLAASGIRRIVLDAQIVRLDAEKLTSESISTSDPPCLIGSGATILAVVNLLSTGDAFKDGLAEARKFAGELSANRIILVPFADASEAGKRLINLSSGISFRDGFYCANCNRSFRRPTHEFLCSFLSGKNVRKDWDTDRIIPVVWKKAFLDLISLPLTSLASVSPGFPPPAYAGEIESLIQAGLGRHSLRERQADFSPGERILSEAALISEQKVRDLLFLVISPGRVLGDEDRGRFNRMMQLLVEQGNTVVCVERKNSEDELKSAGLETATADTFICLLGGAGAGKTMLLKGAGNGSSTLEDVSEIWKLGGAGFSRRPGEYVDLDEALESDRFLLSRLADVVALSELLADYVSSVPEARKRGWKKKELFYARNACKHCSGRGALLLDSGALRRCAACRGTGVDTELLGLSLGDLSLGELLLGTLKNASELRSGSPKLKHRIAELVRWGFASLSISSRMYELPFEKRRELVLFEVLKRKRKRQHTLYLDIPFDGVSRKARDAAMDSINDLIRAGHTLIFSARSSASAGLSGKVVLMPQNRAGSADRL